MHLWILKGISNGNVLVSTTVHTLGMLFWIKKEQTIALLMAWDVKKQLHMQQ